MFGEQIAWTGIVTLVFAWIIRKFCNDDPDQVPMTVKGAVFVMFFGGLIAVFVGFIFQIWNK